MEVRLLYMGALKIRGNVQLNGTIGSQRSGTADRGPWNSRVGARDRRPGARGRRRDRSRLEIAQEVTWVTSRLIGLAPVVHVLTADSIEKRQRRPSTPTLGVANRRPTWLSRTSAPATIQV